MHDDAPLLVDMVEHARHVRGRLERLTRADFDSDVVLQMGFAHLLQIIGEAARRVSQSSRDRFPTLHWKQIVGMRHRIVHEYFRIDLDVIWTTATRDIPELLNALEPEFGPIIDRRAESTEQ